MGSGPGDDVYTTLDTELQQELCRAGQEEYIAMEPDTSGKTAFHGIQAWLRLTWPAGGLGKPDRPV